MQRWPTEIRVVHGEQRAKEALAAQLYASYRLQNRLDLSITTGEIEGMSEQGGDYGS